MSDAEEKLEPSEELINRIRKASFDGESIDISDDILSKDKFDLIAKFAKKVVEGFVSEMCPYSENVFLRTDKIKIQLGSVGYCFGLPRMTMLTIRLPVKKD